MTPVELFRVRLAARTAPLKARGTNQAQVDNLYAVLSALTQRKGYDLLEDEQRVLRACLLLAGAKLPARGLCDLDFFVALDQYQTAHGHKDKGLTRTSIAEVLQGAAYVVGATGSWGTIRGSWFDAMRAPQLMREHSSLALLVRALRGR